MVAAPPPPPPPGSCRTHPNDAVLPEAAASLGGRPFPHPVQDISGLPHQRCGPEGESGGWALRCLAAAQREPTYIRGGLAMLLVPAHAYGVVSRRCWCSHMHTGCIRTGYCWCPHWWQVRLQRTKGGLDITTFVKESRASSDFYAVALAPYYNASLFCATWLRGGCTAPECMLARCTSVCGCLHVWGVCASALAQSHHTMSTMMTVVAHDPAQTRCEQAAAWYARPSVVPPASHTMCGTSTPSSESALLRHRDGDVGGLAKTARTHTHTHTRTHTHTHTHTLAH